MMRWFGPAPFCPACHDCPQVETPAGVPCLHCGEPIEPGESGFELLYEGGYRPEHEECHLRMIVGGLNHLKGLCICCGGSLDPDPPGLTMREAARQAVAYWYRRNKPCK